LCWAPRATALDGNSINALADSQFLDQLLDNLVSHLDLTLRDTPEALRIF
jgi:hypothetical protein